MKPFFILLTVLSTYIAQAAPGPIEVAPAARKSFERTFSGAQEVSWTFTENAYKVTFQVSGQYASAYYAGTGELMVITRNISPLQLPVVLLATLKKDYSQQWISDLMEVSDESGTHYYTTLEDGNQKLILKSEGSTNWLKYKKFEK